MRDSSKHKRIVTPPVSKPPSPVPSEKENGSPPILASLLDLNALDESKSPLRGFLNLFWMAMSFYGFLAVLRNYQEEGKLVSWKLLEFGFHNGHPLRDVFLAHVAFPSLVTFLLAALNHFGIFFLGIQGILALDIFLLAMSFGVSLKAEFPVLQSLMSSLHSLTLIMKFHSFLVYRLEETKYQVTFTHIVWFLMTPSIVFYPNLPYHPLPKNVFWYQLGERSLGLFVGWFITHMTIEHHVYPLLLLPMKPLPLLVELFFPFLIICLILFLSFFEYFLGLLRVLTGFGERKFYADWWNSTTFGEFSRRWNLPVHNFIRCHVYDPLVLEAGLDRKRAILLVFLLSSFIHEAVVQVAFGRFVVPYLFLFQMLQLPITWCMKRISKLPLFGSPICLNMIFWFKMIVGPPLIFLLYAKYNKLPFW